MTRYFLSIAAFAALLVLGACAWAPEEQEIPVSFNLSSAAPKPPAQNVIMGWRVVHWPESRPYLKDPALGYCDRTGDCGSGSH